MQRVILGLIRIYQWTLSPLLGPACRFTPSCSVYTATCIERFGVRRGVYLGLKRLVQCRPLGRFGYDPPPDAYPGDCRCTSEEK